VDSKPLRVLFLTPYFRPYLGGIERAIEQLSFQMQQSASIDAVGVLTTKYSFPRRPQPTWYDKETTPEGISIYRLSGFPRRSLPFYSVPLVWFSPWRLKKYLDEFKPDVIHFVGDGWFWGHFWAWFWYRGRARFVFTPSYHTLPFSRWWLKPINAFLCRISDRVVALTELEAEGVHRAYLTSKNKLGVIGWGASIDEKYGQKPDQSNDEVDIGPVTVLCVGRLGSHKGQRWLLNVYRMARAQFERPVRIVLVGRDEGATAGIENFITQNQLEGEVIVTGEVSDSELAEWYARHSGPDPRRGSEPGGAITGSSVGPQIQRGGRGPRARPAGERSQSPPGIGTRSPGVRSHRVRLASGGREVSGSLSRQPHCSLTRGCNEWIGQRWKKAHARYY